jgi:cell division protein FtsA
VVTVLDIGSTKICCIIGKLKPCAESERLPGRTHQVRVIGIGHQKSLGVKSGTIIDLDGAEQAVRLAVDAAERMAGLTVESLIVNVSAGRLKSQVFSSTVNLGGHEAGEGDIRRVLAAGARLAQRAEREVVHSLPVGFSLDAERGVRDPSGMIGEVLGVDMHVLTADAAPLRNLELCVNRAHLSVERMVATPYASGLSALVDDEAEMGAACIDMGGGTTTISIFSEGRFVHAEVLPVGGGHVTMDLARGLSTRREHAERLKAMHGSVLPMADDDRDMVTIQPMGQDDADVPQHVPRAVMNRIIRARVEETLEIVRDRLNRSGFGGVAGRRVVLTGGASQLAGLPETARRILARNVRLGRPLGVAGLPEPRGGILRFRATGTQGPLGRVGRWIRDSF